MANAGVLRSFGARDKRNRAIVLAGSLVLHAVVLAPLAMRLFEPDASEPAAAFDPTIYIEMEPRPLLNGETARPPAPAAARPADTRPLTGPVADPTAPRRPEDEDRPAPPSPRIAAAPPAGAPAPPATLNPWSVAGDRNDAAIVQSLRTGVAGCRNMEGRLSAAEQALCDQRFGEAGARAGSPGARTLTPAEARRQAQFARDGAAALERYESKRRPLGSGVGITGPADCVGSNFGTGCAGAHLDPSIRQGATTNLRQGGNQTEGMRRIPGNE